MEERTRDKSRRGLASVDAATRREIARKGGQAAHAQGTAHKFTSAEARAAGRKGGAARSKNRTQRAESGQPGGRRRRPRPLSSST
ncbi:MAG TPA: stress-induced protein [Candidatus Binatia bacterium]|nr:stress-induced protein [Candidatus Binatia bacterium]